MPKQSNAHDLTTPSRSRSRPAHRVLALMLALAALASACAGTAAASMDHGDHPAASTNDHGGHHGKHRLNPRDQAAAMLATAAYQDVGTAEKAGYASSLNTLGCFQQPGTGGMGLHYIKESLMDDKVDITKPEALVYELDAAGHITGLVAHEYIVPVEAWKSHKPPRLFGMAFHRHPTLPLWVLHTWLWKNNPTGVFEDWNPAVRLCPAGVPIFGRDLPKPAPAP